MSDDEDRFGRRVERKVAAAFGAERDAERVGRAAVRVRKAEGVAWSPSFVADRMADAPKGHSVPEKWNWLLEHVGGFDGDSGEYALDGCE
jgi:hypothetical protein